MNINIKSYPIQAQILFNDEKTGEVHSVFDNTVNVLVAGHLFAITHRDVVITPMSIQLDISAQEFAMMTFCRKDKVYFNHQGLVVSGYILKKQQAIIHDDVIIPFVLDIEHYNEPFMHFKQEVYKMLNSSNVHGEMVNAWLKSQGLRGGELSIVGNYFFHQFKQLQQEKLNQIKINLIVSLLGAGEGLTPSGDDFITGILASLHYLKLRPTIQMLLESLVHQIQLKLNSTTLVSQEYLKYAINGRFNKHVHDMFEHHQKNQPTNDFLLKISKIGHSSGSDFLVGMYFGLEIGGI